jgi:hypothetical protein
MPTDMSIHGPSMAKSILAPLPVNQVMVLLDPPRTPTGVSLSHPSLHLLTKLGPSDRDSGIVACGGSGSAPTSWNLDAGSSVIAQWSGGSNGKSVWPEEHHGKSSYR